MDAADQPGDEAGEREGQQLVPIGGDPEHLGDVLVVTNREEAHAPPRAIDRERGKDGDERDRERQMVERRGRRAEERRHRHRREEHAGAAVESRVEGDRREHEGDREREEPEQLAAHHADAEDDRGDDAPEERRDQPGRGQAQQERGIERSREGRRGIDPRAEERGVTEAEVPRVSAQDVPAGRQ